MYQPKKKIIIIQGSSSYVLIILLLSNQSPNRQILNIKRWGTTPPIPSLRLRSIRYMCHPPVKQKVCKIHQPIPWCGQYKCYGMLTHPNTLIVHLYVVHIDKLELRTTQNNAYIIKHCVVIRQIYIFPPIHCSPKWKGGITIKVEMSLTTHQWWQSAFLLIHCFLHMKMWLWVWYDVILLSS